MRGLLGGTMMVVATAAVPAAPSSPYTEFTDPHLVQGRALWLDTCEGCHGYGIAGAPIPMQPTEWAPRLRKPLPLLYRHAIEGFFGPDDTYMPPRGGNPELSDSQVRAAVDYMVALARHHINVTR